MMSVYKSTLKYTLSSLLATIGFMSFSQDDCTSPIMVTDLTGVVCSTSSPSATDFISGSCEEGANDTWFQFTAQGETADFTVSNAFNGWRPEYLLISSSDNTCAGTLFENECADQNGNYTIITGSTVTLVPGDTYWVVVSSGANGGTPGNGTIEVCVNNPLAPPNDEFCNATFTMPDGSCQTGQTNVGATADWFGGCASANPTVYYEVTLTGANTQLDIDLTTNTFGGGAEIIVLTNNDVCPINSGTTIAGQYCGSTGSVISIGALTAGVTYFVLISTDAGNEGTFDVCFTEAVGGPSCPASSDDCAAGILINTTQGVTDCVSSCNTGAGTGPDFAQANCYDFPEETVWFEVTSGAGDANLDITITSTDLTAPYFAVFGTAGCAGGTWPIIGSDCTGAGGSVSSTVGITPNTTYLIAVSDLNGLEGDFEICATLQPDLSLCNIGDALTESASSDPATPVGGPYSPGEVVDFCYNIIEYRKENCNWLQGIVPSFGDCWDASSFDADGMPVTTLALVTAGGSAGTWQWWPAGSILYNDLGGSGSLPADTDVGAGWFFNCTACGNGVEGSDPNDTWGDGDANGPAQCDINGNGFTWEVCFQLTAGPVSNCASGATDCSVSMKTYADAEIGVYTNLGCAGDASLVAPASLLCILCPTFTAANAIACDSYTFPIIGGTGLTGGELYYSGTNGTSPNGGPWNATDVVNFADFPSYPFTLFVFDAAECGVEVPFDLTINALPVINIPLPTPGCGTAAIQLNETLGTAGTSWFWSSNGSATITSTNSQNPVITNGVDGEIFEVIVTDANGCVDSLEAAITVNPLPVIEATPTPPIACNGTDGFIDVVLNPISTSTGSLSWTGAAIGTNASADITVDSPDIPTLSPGSYNVTFTDDNGCVSNTESVILNNPGAPVLDLITDTTSCGVDFLLDNNDITGTTTGFEAYYDAGVFGATVIPDLTVFSSTNTPMTIFAIDSNGVCASIVSFIVTVNPIPTVGATIPQVLCANVLTTAVTFVGAEVGTTYTWSNDNTLTGLIASGTGNIASFMATNTTGLPIVSTVTVTPTLNGCIGVDDVFTITVNPIPTIVAPTDQALCANASTSVVTFTGNNAGTTYNWVNDDITIGLAASGAGDIAFFTATNATGSPIVSTVTVTPVLNGCIGVSDVFTITVNPIPVISATPTDPTACLATNGSIEVASTSGISTGTLSWTGTSSGSNNSVNIVTDSPDITGIGAGTYNITLMDANGCVSNTEVSVLADPGAPSVDVIAGQTLCADDQTTAVGFAGSDAGTTYNWTNDNVSTGLAASGTGDISSFTATNTVLTAIVSTITVTPVLAGCTGTSESFTITVNTTPTLTLVNPAAVCEPGLIDITQVSVSSSDVGILSYYTDAGLSILVPDATQVSTGLYHIEADNAGCTSNGTVDVTINPIPSAPSAGADSEYCSTVTFDGMTSSGNGGTMNWYSDAGLTSVITSENNLVPTNTVGTTTYYVTETLNGCEGPASQVIITVNLCTITVPTAFTPDEDGVNDDWEILDIDMTYPENMVYVYNRWGNLLFTSVQGDYDNNRWDGTFNGKDLPVGSYYFIIEHNNEEGEKTNGIVSIILNK